MSLAEKLGNIYTSLDDAFSDINNALSTKGSDEAENIRDIANKISIIKTGVSFDDIAMRNITTVELSPACLAVFNNAFSGCSSLATVIFSNSIMVIGSSAFFGCSQLTNVNIPDSVTMIGSRAFSGCSNLTNINIPDSVTTIEPDVFYNCTSLDNITLHSGITRIGSQAFYNCGSKNQTFRIYLKSTTPPILDSNNVFPTGISRIYVPEGSGEAYKSATNWSTYASNIREDTEV